MSVIGVLAVDPGGSTGAVWGTFDLSQRSIADCLSTAYWGSATITGPEISQATELCSMWSQVKVLPADNYALVIEDYIQQPTMHALDPESLMPIRVAWCMVGMLVKEYGVAFPRLNFQTPGERMKESQLKAHGAWIRGRGHERAAMGHMLAFLSARLR